MKIKESLKQLLFLTCLFGFLASYAYISTGCGGGSSSSDSDDTIEDADDTFDKKTLLSNVANKVVLPLLVEFEVKLDSLNSALIDYVASLESNASNIDELLLDAQNAWQEAMGVWQEIEVLQFGPLGSSSKVTGGQSYRDEIYSWPTTNPCLVDQEIVRNEFESANYLDTKLVNSYGLDAIEYLLFGSNVENQCSSQIDINLDGSWSDLSEDVITLRKAKFAKVIGSKMSEDADQMLNEWGESSSFYNSFITAGEEGSSFNTISQAMNDIFAGMFYIELDVKDNKVAESFGFADNLVSDFSKLEFQFSEFNRTALIHNLKGFQKLYHAGESTDLGFDDYLESKNEKDLADEIDSLVASLIVDLEAMELSFKIMISTENLTEITAFYTKLKSLTDLIKNDFVAILNLEIPQEGAGDND